MCNYTYKTANCADIGISMVDIPAGSFLMGCDMPGKNMKRALLEQAPLPADCTNSDSHPYWGHPQHRVNIQSFQMSKTEVTDNQFKQYLAATMLRNDEFIRYNLFGDDAPAIFVSWDDAQEFISWLNKTYGGGYRLPTEAEWEYACRAGGMHLYCGSDNPDAVGWYYDNSPKKGPQPVGIKQANAFGLYDMSGNAWEWVQDCWHESYQGAPNDGSAWVNRCSDGNRRVMRGGANSFPSHTMRTVFRIDHSRGIRSGEFGFRVARDK